MHNSQKLLLSRKKAGKIAAKANKRAATWGVLWENIWEKIPQAQWSTRPLKGSRAKEEIARVTEIKEQNMVHKMTVQETIGRAIKEFGIKDKSQKAKINKLAHLMALATTRADHQQAKQIRALIGLEVMKATGDREKSLSFLSYLDYAIQANWANIERERRKLNPLDEE
jgi:hypothetical protein